MFVYPAVLVASTVVAFFAENGTKKQHGAHRPETQATGRGWSIAAAAVALILIAVSALRWRVGADYEAYETLFPIYSREITQGVDVLGEPGMRVLAWIAMETTGDSALMFALAALLTIGLMVYQLWRWSPAFAFSIAMFVLAGPWIVSFNGVRQSLACAILLAGHRFIIKREPWRWSAVVAAAALFHLSAVVCLLFYLIPTKRTSASIQFGLLLLGVIGLFSVGTLIEVVSGMSSATAGSDYAYAFRQINPLRIAFAAVPITLYWLLNNKRQIAEQQSWFYVNMLAVYASLYLMSATSALFARFALYPLVFLPIGIAAVTSVERPKDQAIIRGTLVLLYLVFLFIDVSSSGTLHSFQWLFQRPE